MTRKHNKTARAFLAGVDGELGEELRRVLLSTRCELTEDPKKAQIVFCASKSQAFRDALGRFGQVPVVVVSRLPDVDGWIDALEAGAADYCASPFEEVQVRWLLETHIGRRHEPPKARHAAA
jgi:PleD family two-component response regulator